MGRSALRGTFPHDPNAARFPSVMRGDRTSTRASVDAGCLGQGHLRVLLPGALCLGRACARPRAGSEGEAEDLAQEAFARALERWDRIRTMESPVSYVYRLSYSRGVLPLRSTPDLFVALDHRTRQSMPLPRRPGSVPIGRRPRR